MEETLTQLAESIDQSQSKFYGVVIGTVINLLDPLMLGRVQVQLPFIDDADLSPWARIASPMAGLAYGMYFIPNMGDDVLVAFEQGDVHAPYILGSLWNATAPPPLPSPLLQMRMIRTPLGNEIILADLVGSITIKTPTGETIMLSPAGVQILAGGNIVSLSSAGVSITAAADVTLTAAKSISLTAPQVSINGVTKTDLTSQGMCSVSAPMVKIN